MSDILIKPDPEVTGASPAAFADEDIYEDTGDLEFNPDANFQKLYLARVPKDVWEQWSKLDDDAEIQLGTIRQSSVKDHDGVERHKLQMLLRSDLAQHQLVPKEYELQITSEAVNNTFIFTEQDLPGYKSRSKNKFDPTTANMPARLNRSKVEKTGDRPQWDKNKKYQPFIRRAIPKKTTLAGRVAHEVNCIAVTNEESRWMLAEQTTKAMQPKASTKYIKGEASSMANGFIQLGTVHAQGIFSGFIKDTGANKSKAATQDSKTARMAKNDLLDLIFDCFKRYNFWSMKALRSELQQPEAYLRETLDKIADMPRSGRFAMHWTLKPEYRDATNAGADDASAPIITGAGDGVDDSDMGDQDVEDEDDEEVKMEDVLP